MPDKNQKQPLFEVERGIQEQIANLMTFLTEPHAASPVYESILAMVERSMLKTALKRNGNIKSKAAVYLGINRNSLQAKMVRLGLEEKADK